MTIDPALMPENPLEFWGVSTRSMYGMIKRPSIISADLEDFVDLYDAETHLYDRSLTLGEFWAERPPEVSMIF